MTYDSARTIFNQADDGADHVIGATGEDPGGGFHIQHQYVDYTQRTGVLDVSLDGVANDGDPGNGGEHDNIEPSVKVIEGEHNGVNHLVGSDGPNNLIGGGLGDTIRGLGGNDSIDGRGGNDYESGNGGNDTFVQDGIPNGADRILGGLGFDTVSYQHRRHQVIASIDGKANDGAPGEHDSIDSYVNALRGGGGWDTLTGNNARNYLFGGPGTDHLYAKGGDDHIHAIDAGVDYVYGGTGHDYAQVDRKDVTNSVEKRTDPRGAEFRVSRAAVGP
jgi:Ca2+-binding RTX toxin-like protein